MDLRSPSLLDEALGFEKAGKTRGILVVVEDCVETSGTFVLHYLMKRTLSSKMSNAIIVVAFAQSFSHYDRVLRKLGCNLTVHKHNGRFVFFDMLAEHAGRDEEKDKADRFMKLYLKIQKELEALPEVSITIVIDDLSLMEVAADGSSNHVLDFVHYCHTLVSEFDCSLIMLNHADIYSCMERPMLLLKMEYLADILIKAEPLATGLAADVHGQVNQPLRHEYSLREYSLREYSILSRKEMSLYFLLMCGVLYTELLVDYSTVQV